MRRCKYSEPVKIHGLKECRRQIAFKEYIIFAAYVFRGVIVCWEALGGDARTDELAVWEGVPRNILERDNIPPCVSCEASELRGELREGP